MSSDKSGKIYSASIHKLTESNVKPANHIDCKGILAVLEKIDEMRTK